MLCEITTGTLNTPPMKETAMGTAMAAVALEPAVAADLLRPMVNETQADDFGCKGRLKDGPLLVHIDTKMSKT